MDKTRKLLIIEPSSAKQDLYKSTLSGIPECKPECKIEVVNNNREAFDVLGNSSRNQWECYDLVLMNGGPAYETGMKGLDFLEQIRGFDLKVILIYERAVQTKYAYGDTMYFNEIDYGVEALKKGVYAYLIGPLPNPRLIRVYSELALKLLYGQREGRELLRFGGQIETATILFADIEGFSSTTEKAKRINNIVIIINRYFQEAGRIIDINHGIVSRYIGDEIMATFPKPGIKGSGIKEALDTSIALKDFFKTDVEINERFKRYGKGFKINMGICYGEIMSGSFGSRIKKDYTVFGEDVNLASRLTAKAVNGEILISEKSVEKLKVEHPELSLSKESMNGDKYDEKWIFKSTKEGYTLWKLKNQLALKNIEGKVTIFEVGQKVNCK